LVQRHLPLHHPSSAPVRLTITMPSKRANTGSCKGTSAVKKQRVEAEVVSVDPLLEACTPMLNVLKTGGAIADDDTGAVAELLCAALPFALKATEGSEKRHAYQEQLLGVVAAQLSGIVASQRDSVAAIEKRGADLEADKTQGMACREEIAVRLAEKAQARDAAAEATKKQQEAFAEAQAKLTSAKGDAKTADEEKQAGEKDRDEYAAGLAELWVPLKNGEIAGKQWREREKMLGRLESKMKVAGAHPSLLAALPVALKLKPDARSDFAQATVVHAEELYSQHLELLKQRVEQLAAQVSARAASVTEAEGGVKAAQEALDAAMDADIAAQNAWVEVASEETMHEAKMKTLDPRSAQLDEELAQARSEVASLQEVLDSFEALRPVGAMQKMLEVSEEATTTDVQDVQVPAVQAEQ